MGKIGSSTRMVTAKHAGVTFHRPKWLKRREVKLRRQRAELKAIEQARPAFDPTPRLRRPE